MEKQQHWQRAIDQYQRIVDGQRMPIDTGILETVVALNLLGLKTVASCEGHLSWGRGAPWVHIRADDTQREDALVVLRRREIQQQIETQSLSKDETNRLYADFHQLEKQAEIKHVLLRQKLLEALALFYEDRQVPYDQRLSIQDLGVISRLESQGVSVLPGCVPEVKQQKLIAYQEEMRAFTVFLKCLYFGGEKNDRT